MDVISDRGPESSIQDVEMKSTFLRVAAPVTGRSERPINIPKTSRSPRSGPQALRPRCVCPLYGVRAIAGRRARMEDAVSIVENLLEVSQSSSTTERNHASNAVGKSSKEADHSIEDGSLSFGESRDNLKMKDQALIMSPLVETETFHFFGVYDGHNGPYAAHHCRGRLHENLRATYHELCVSTGSGACGGGGDSPNAESEALTFDVLSSSPNSKSSSSSSSPTLMSSSLSSLWGVENGSDLNGQKSQRGMLNGSLAAQELFLETFRRTDSQFSEYRCAERVGTTALAALVGSKRIIVGSCGDSRAVLYRSGEAIQLSNDHRLDQLEEKNRIENCGGQITYWNGPRVMGVLAMSRAIGDLCFRPYGVICDPEVTTKDRSIHDEYLLLATDGLWDVLTNEEAYRIIRHTIATNQREGVNHQSCIQSSANRLTRIAIDRGSRDNITVVLLDLQSDC